MSGQAPHPFDIWLATRLATLVGTEERRTYANPIPLDAPDSPDLGIPPGKIPDFLVRADDGACVLLEHTRTLRNDVGRHESKKVRILEAVREAGATCLKDGLLILQDPNYRVPPKKRRRGDARAQAEWQGLVNSLRCLSKNVAGRDKAESEGPPRLIYLRFPFLKNGLGVSFWDKRDRTLGELVGSAAKEAEIKFANVSTKLGPRRSILVCVSMAISNSRAEGTQILREMHEHRPFVALTDVCLAELLGESANIHWLWPRNSSSLWLRLSPDEQRMAVDYIELI
jgi:hypothetical protein